MVIGRCRHRGICRLAGAGYPAMGASGCAGWTKSSKALSAAAIGAYIGAAYWFTSSTSFANPAVTIGRIFTDTFAGIAPASVPGFVCAQLIGGTLGTSLALLLYPDTATAAAHIVIPHPATPGPGGFTP
jgi:glycerol uptake facilitator-like aquaporin